VLYARWGSLAYGAMAGAAAAVGAAAIAVVRLMRLGGRYSQV
jgi:hypothetical protein